MLDFPFRHSHKTVHWTKLRAIVTDKILRTTELAAFTNVPLVMSLMSNSYIPEAVKEMQFADILMDTLSLF